MSAPARGINRTRPISYQILDDQLEQFSINSQGEIFLRRPLDYERRQHFRLRVLASHTKFSDICQLQVNVLNVNDNKPKVSLEEGLGASSRWLGWDGMGSNGIGSDPIR